MQFYKAKQHYADVNYAYAITCHKSQGSTYKNVYVDLADISGNDNVVERNRIIYTAITRASEKAVIITNK
jgi:ATP-dependent exoDNAse (exonuclease V) alpha subunit